jgi:ABC-2 type transport system ATP-binding protein
MIDMHETLSVRPRGLSKSFGEVVALDGVDLEIAQGQVHGLVGPNGAGKTTLLGLLLARQSPPSASITARSRTTSPGSCPPRRCRSPASCRESARVRPVLCAT